MELGSMEDILVKRVENRVTIVQKYLREVKTEKGLSDLFIYMCRKEFYLAVFKFSLNSY